RSCADIAAAVNTPPPGSAARRSDRPAPRLAGGLCRRGRHPPNDRPAHARCSTWTGRAATEPPSYAPLLSIAPSPASGRYPHCIVVGGGHVALTTLAANRISTPTPAATR